MKWIKPLMLIFILTIFLTIVSSTKAATLPKPTRTFVFYGDSITLETMGSEVENGVPSLETLMNQKNTRITTTVINKGTNGWTTTDALATIPNDLKTTSAKYIVISLGTNDAKNCDPNTFYNNYSSLVRTVLLAGKVPVVPVIMWSSAQPFNSCIPKLNAKINQLYWTYFFQIERGPNLWNTFYGHTNWLYADGIHPNYIGIGEYRKAWANAISN